MVWISLEVITAVWRTQAGAGAHTGRDAQLEHGALGLACGAQ